jgi:hypothetical protein
MAKDAADVWRECFEKWPTEIERRGVVVTSFNEQIPFESFLSSPDMVLLERRAPDTVGARLVLVGYQFIQAIKIVDVVKPKAFLGMGFSPAPAGKK